MFGFIVIVINPVQDSSSALIMDMTTRGYRICRQNLLAQVRYSYLDVSRWPCVNHSMSNLLLLVQPLVYKRCDNAQLWILLGEVGGAFGRRDEIEK